MMDRPLHRVSTFRNPYRITLTICGSSTPPSNLNSTIVSSLPPNTTTITIATTCPPLTHPAVLRPLQASQRRRHQHPQARYDAIHRTRQMDRLGIAKGQVGGERQEGIRPGLVCRESHMSFRGGGMRVRKLEIRLAD
jgi:hypothetical protein